jgi:hypothetical protein
VLKIAIFLFHKATPSLNTIGVTPKNQQKILYRMPRKVRVTVKPPIIINNG